MVNALIIVWNLSSLKHSGMEKKAKINKAYCKAVIISFLKMHADLRKCRAWVG
jgi:O-glycosyl hydrolase